jgi:hypothetical protein
VCEVCVIDHVMKFLNFLNCCNPALLQAS